MLLDSDVELLVGVTDVLYSLVLVTLVEVEAAELDWLDVVLLVGVTDVLYSLVLVTLVEVGAAELDWLDVGSDGVPVPQ